MTPAVRLLSPNQDRPSTGHETRDSAISAPVGRRARNRPIEAPGASSKSESCKHRSGHGGGERGATAPGVKHRSDGAAARDSFHHPEGVRADDRVGDDRMTRVGDGGRTLRNRSEAAAAACRGLAIANACSCDGLRATVSSGRGRGRTGPACPAHVVSSRHPLLRRAAKGQHPVAARDVAKVAKGVTSVARLGGVSACDWARSLPRIGLMLAGAGWAAWVSAPGIAGDPREAVVVCQQVRAELLRAGEDDRVGQSQVVVAGT